MAKAVHYGQRSTYMWRPARKRTFKSPLDKALTHEVEWQKVASVFEAATSLEKPSFVYFVGEYYDGPVKIGVTRNPIDRLRQMQTGNSRRLTIERVLVGNLACEKLIHELWEPFAMMAVNRRTRNPGTEWFLPDIREPLFPVVDMAAAEQAKQLHAVNVGAEPPSFEELERTIRLAHIAHDHVVAGRDEDRFLARGAGYTGPRKTRI